MIVVEEAILEAIVDQRQRAIDNLSDERQALQDSTSKFIEGLSDALSKERDMYNANQSQEELNKMRRQLAILQRSGGSGSEIRSLQDSIRSKEKDTYFEEQQRQIDAIQEASDLQLERLDAQIELMTETLEYEKNHGLLWEAVYQQMMKTPEDITSFIMTENSKYWANSPLKSSEEMNNILFMSEQWTSFRDSQNQQLSDLYDKTADKISIAEAVYGADNSWSIFTTAMSNLYGQQWQQKAEEYKTAFQTGMAQHGDITKAEETINTAITNLGDKMVSALSKPDPVEITENTTAGTIEETPTSPTNNSNVKHNNSNGKKNNSGTKKEYEYWVGGTSYSTEAEANKALKKLQSDTKKLYENNKGGTNAYSYYTDMKQAEQQTVKKKEKVKTKAFGGMVDETGMELVHAKEAVLTAEQASILRNDILGSNKNSLMNLLLDFRAAYTGLDGGTYSSINDNNSVVIENASVQMNVSEIASDYDAQRAGEQAMQKMLEIARKTSAKNSIRR